MDFFAKLNNFIKESHTELKKVVWPTRQETVRYTTVVIVISAAVALFLGGMDYLFQWILNNFVL